MIEFAAVADRGHRTATESLRRAPPHILAAVNRARARTGLPVLLTQRERAAIDLEVAAEPAQAHIAIWSKAEGWRRIPVTGKRTPSRTADRKPDAGPHVCRVLLMPFYLDAAAQDVGRALPETISRHACGTAAELNAPGQDWSLRDDHDGPVFNFVRDRLRAIDTPHGLVVEWLPDLRLPWARDAVQAIERGNNAVSVGFKAHERRIARLPYPMEMVARATLDHIALLTRGGRPCYPGARAKVFRNSRQHDAGELDKQIAELVDRCRYYARAGGGR